MKGNKESNEEKKHHAMCCDTNYTVKVHSAGWMNVGNISSS